VADALIKAANGLCYFCTDPNQQVKVLTANRIARFFKDFSSGGLLAHGDPVRSSIRALGYLGAVDWRYTIIATLNETQADPRFQSEALAACARLIVKASPEDLVWTIRSLEDIFKKFASRRALREVDLVDVDALQGVKGILRQRKAAEGADVFLDRVLPSWESDLSPAQQFIRECCAHVLGALRLPRVVHNLKNVLLSAEEPVPLRAECAMALGRIHTRESATALREVIASLPEPLGEWRLCVRFALAKVAYVGPNPIANLRDVFEGDQPQFNPPEFVRAVGLCKANQLLPRLVPQPT
jgi:hypothetical protein